MHCLTGVVQLIQVSLVDIWRSFHLSGTFKIREHHLFLRNNIILCYKRSSLEVGYL